MAQQHIAETGSGAVLAASFWTTLERAVSARGGTADDFDWLGTPEAEPLIEQLADFIVASARPGPQVFHVTLDRSLSVDALVQAGGYDSTNPDINLRNFRVSRDEDTDIDLALVRFTQVLATADVLHALAAQGLRPATLRELLAFGAQYPPLQRQFPIVALGSVWMNSEGQRYIAYLWGHARERGLGLGWLVRWWREVYRFAAVRQAAA